MHRFNDLRLFWKLMLVTLLIPLAVSTMAIAGLSSSNDLKYQYDNLYGFMLIPIMALDAGHLHLANLGSTTLDLQKETRAADRSAEGKTLRAEDTATVAVISDYEANWVTTLSPQFTADLRAAGKLGLQQDELASLKAFHADHDAYSPLRDALFAGKTVNRQQLKARLSAMGSAFDRLVRVNRDFADISNASAQDAIQQMRWKLVIVGCVSTVLALLVTWFLARTIARPIQQLSAAARRMAVGDIAVVDVLPPASRDEVGALSTSIRGMVCYQQEMASVAGAIAAGNLMRTVQPKGAADQLGHALATMVSSLRALISQVAHTSEEVGSGADQLAQATQQIGQASTQIAKAIEDVARGASEQSRSATTMIDHIGNLGGAIEQVAGGVERQRQTAGPVGQAIADMAAALTAAGESLAAMTAAATDAAATARQGGAVVGETVESIATVRTAVERSAEQVAALGRRSSEIGQIVEAINDIAEQTNLLALNAAIEAARAGEHGKGFTVVAAEVRKLAERASNETKEITGRIKGIQEQVAEVVAAMQGASAAVGRSAALGDQTRATLESIVAVVEGTRAQVQRIGDANEALARNVEAIASLGKARDAIVAETEAAAKAMRARAEMVSQAVEGIAAVSEESAASAEEVSASTEEQTAGVEEMAAGAQELAALAIQLQEMVGRFVVDAEPGAEAEQPPPVPRRRASDWRTPTAAPVWGEQRHG